MKLKVYFYRQHTPFKASDVYTILTRSIKTYNIIPYLNHVTLYQR